MNSAGVGAAANGQVMKSNHIKIMQNTNGERNQLLLVSNQDSSIIASKKGQRLQQKINTSIGLPVTDNIKQQISLPTPINGGTSNTGGSSLSNYQQMQMQQMVSQQHKKTQSMPGSSPGKRSFNVNNAPADYAMRVEDAISPINRRGQQNNLPHVGASSQNAGSPRQRR